jgi:hypothetical protein
MLVLNFKNLYFYQKNNYNMNLNLQFSSSSDIFHTSHFFGLDNPFCKPQAKVGKKCDQRKINHSYFVKIQLRRPLIPSPVDKNDENSECGVKAEEFFQFCSS